MVGQAGKVGYQEALSLFAQVSETWKSVDQRTALDMLSASDEWAWEGLRHAGMFYSDHYRASTSGDFFWQSRLGLALLNWARSGGYNTDLRRVANDGDLPNAGPDLVSDSNSVERLRALDRLRRHERIIRAGWLWLAGRVAGDEPEEAIEVCFPLLYAPVSVADVVWRIGDVQLHPLVANLGLAWIDLLPPFADLVAAAELPGGMVLGSPARSLKLNPLIAAARQAVGQLGLDFSEVLFSTDPATRRSSSSVALIVGTGLFVDPRLVSSSSGERFRRWSTVPGAGGSAFGSLYGAAQGHRIGAVVIKPSKLEGALNVSKWPEPGDLNGAVKHQTRPLNSDQRRLVQLARHEPITAVTGPPGTGKTHALCEVALDAVGRGESVLVATQSLFAIDVLARQLAAVGGPLPVLFGGSESSRHYADQMTDLLNAGSVVQAEASDLAAARNYRNACWDRVQDQIAGHMKWSDSDANLALRLGRDEVDGDSEREGLLHARSLRQLSYADSQLHRANAQWLRSEMVRQTRSRRRRRLLYRVAAAARAGREQREQLLAGSDMATLLGAAPLWLGSVDDINQVLPMAPAKFDLVILDEASQIDQMTASGALLRASRAVVCGDTRQLRHDGFDGIDCASADGSIDLARDSIFDHAIGAGPLVALHRHYRSDPHLISFSSERFYDGQLWPATRNPGNDNANRIGTVLVGGNQDESGVNRVEVEAVLSLLRKSSAASVGVISPFDSQVTALTEAILDALTPTEIEAQAIEVGSVQAFQGAEFDQVIASLVLDDESTKERWDELNDPSLFNVMITRARSRMIVVTSVADPPGLAGEYLRHAESGMEHHSPREPCDPWTAEVRTALTGAGIEVESGYDVGGFTVDIALREPTGPNGEPVAVCCRVGEGNHLERELLLLRMGWHVIYAFESEWSGRLDRLVKQEIRSLLEEP